MHLKNVIWQALNTRQTAFAESCEAARRFMPEVTALCGFAEPNDDGYAGLACLAGAGGTAAIFLDRPYEPREGWEYVVGAPLLQMIRENGNGSPHINQALESKAKSLPIHCHPERSGTESEANRYTQSRDLVSSRCSQEIAGRPSSSLGNVSRIMNSAEIVELGDGDSPEMLELTALTKPGPFGPRTHELGYYVGIRDQGKLVAMAGERLKVPGFTEVSAVCTHPDHLGKGYAAALMTEVMRAIRERGETPFLHVRADNARAIAIYERLGFRTAWQGHFAVLRNSVVSEARPA